MDNPSELPLEWKGLDYRSIVWPERDEVIRLSKENPQVKVISQLENIAGFQVHFVEQWIQERRRFYDTVIAFTGNMEHQVKVCLVSFGDAETFCNLFAGFPTDSFKSVELAIGHVMVTNLNKFPSRLNLVEVPDGDVREHLPKMYIAVNMKKLGCAGRASVSLHQLVETQEKFRGLFRISPAVPFDFAVLEMVRLAQKALTIHGFLPSSFDCDGLLCDVTHEAIKNYRAAYGILGNGAADKSVSLVPKLLFHLLSTIMIAKNNLQFLNIQPPKDPFSENLHFKKAIQTFQESKGMTPTGILTMEILLALEKACKKLKISIHTASVMLYDDKEMQDFENFVDHMNVDRIRYLWLGKGKAQDSMKIGKVFKQGLSELTKPLEGSVGFLKGMGGGVAESFSNKVDELKDSYKSAKDKGALRRDKDKDPHREGKERPYSFLIGRSSTGMDYPLSPSTEFPPVVKEKEREKEKEESPPSIPSEKVSVEAFPETHSDALVSMTEMEEALLEIKENDFKLSSVIKKLEDLSRDYDQEIAVVRRVHSKNLAFYELLEKKITTQGERNLELNNLIEKMDVGNSMLHYQSSVAEAKVKESEETVESFSKLAQELDMQLKKDGYEPGSFLLLLYLLFFSVLMAINKLIPIPFFPIQRDRSEFFSSELLPDSQEK